MENGDLLDFLKLQFLVKKIILFYPEYQKTIFSAIICAKKQQIRKKIDFWTKTLLENVDFLSLLKLQYSGLKIILFYPEYQKTIFSDLISPKNTNKKKFDFWTKTMDYPPWKMFLFFDFLKLKFSGLKFILFYLEYQETIFSNIILQKH